MKFRFPGAGILYNDNDQWAKERFKQVEYQWLPWWCYWEAWSSSVICLGFLAAIVALATFLIKKVTG